VRDLVVGMTVILSDGTVAKSGGKVMPTPRLCGEVPGPYRQHPLEAAGLAERF
jgi:hypothetical protein